MGPRALLLLNRHARQAGQQLDAALEHLRQAGLRVTPAAPRHAQELADLVRRARRSVELVVVAGGDGTLNRAADVLVETQLPLGILPLGTANDLARTLALPVDVPGACRVIAAGHTRRIDVGQVNDKHFFNVASVGLSTSIAQQLTREAKGRWGTLAYAATALRVLWQSRPFHAIIRTPTAVVRVKTIQIAVGNGRYYGGGMTIAADATIDDSRLHLYSIEVRRWWQVIPLLPALRYGRTHLVKQVRNLAGPDFVIHTHRPQAVNTDGELTTHTPAHFRVVPKALSVFVPASSEPAA